MGDPATIGELAGLFRVELQAYCYRMLGSVDDADDVVQEVMVRAWRALGRFEDMPPGPEDRLLEWESVETAFVAALQWLGPRQLAVLVLREAVGFSAREVADQRDTTVAPVNSALQRARKALDPLRDDTSQQAALRLLGDAAVREPAGRYAAAWERGDVAAIVAMLTEDAKYSMPPLPEWFTGRDAIGSFPLDAVTAGPWRFLPTRANGQLAFGTYRWDAVRSVHIPAGLDVLTLRGAAVAEVVSFLDADFDRFGLPAVISGATLRRPGPRPSRTAPDARGSRASRQAMEGTATGSPPQAPGRPLRR
ncbi:nuclear transport factor 2 family protein [Glycomyces sp. TRM65418]|nr:sigma factor [Glycomyces sp. TRM65418]MCC3765159.1 nuclear transport factor 2 family protein [Glycomyces sp. TRM65418]QZD54785.1 nuclear transport factor 2 family protein [Glycomyces sp. TRM65418]